MQQRIVQREGNPKSVQSLLRSTIRIIIHLDLVQVIDCKALIVPHHPVKLRRAPTFLIDAADN
jgi:hypothetical protein